jgi:hypothetical protein
LRWCLDYRCFDLFKFKFAERRAREAPLIAEVCDSPARSMDDCLRSLSSKARSAEASGLRKGFLTREKRTKGILKKASSIQSPSSPLKPSEVSGSSTCSAQNAEQSASGERAFSGVVVERRVEKSFETSTSVTHEQSIGSTQEDVRHPHYPFSTPHVLLLFPPVTRAAARGTGNSMAFSVESVLCVSSSLSCCEFNLYLAIRA